MNNEIFIKKFKQSFIFITIEKIHFVKNNLTLYDVYRTERKRLCGASINPQRKVELVNEKVLEIDITVPATEYN